MKFSGVESKSLEKENFHYVFTYSIKWASEIRIMFHVAVMQGRLRNEKKKHDARAKLLFFLLVFFAILVAIAIILALAPCSCDPEILQLC